jgi:hypothetical protein
MNVEDYFDFLDANDIRILDFGSLVAKV